MSISHNIIKDQSLSLDVEAWLANNKPHVLKMGESLGEVRFVRTASSNNSVQENIKREKEREQKILVRKKEAEFKKQQAAEQRKITLEQRLAEQQRLVAQFKKNAVNGDFKRFMSECAYTKTVFSSALRTPIRNDKSFERFKKSVNSFKYGCPVERKKKEKTRKSERSRMREVTALKNIAIGNCQDRFQAVCGKHGITEYAVFMNKFARCLLCVSERIAAKKKAKNPVPRRQEQNLKAMKEAVNGGFKTFLGVCEKHDKTVFVVATHKGVSRYRCQICKTRNNVKKPKAKKVPKIAIHSEQYMCKAHNTEKKLEAIAQGLKSFTGLCVKHGEVEYVIYRERCACTECRKSDDRVRRGFESNSEKRKIIELNRELMRLAIDLGEKSFTGVCQTHGESKFRLKIAKNTKIGFSYACDSCKRT